MHRRSSGEDEEVAGCMAARQEARFGGQDEGGAANAVLLLDRAKKVAGDSPPEKNQTLPEKWLPEKRRRWPERNQYSSCQLEEEDDVGVVTPILYINLLNLQLILHHFNVLHTHQVILLPLVYHLVMVNHLLPPDSHIEVDRRLVISVEDVSNPRRFVPSSLTRDIISEVISRMPYPADNWKSYCSDMKKMLFNDFKEKYRFSSNYDRTMAKTVWEQTCMDRYLDYLAKARAAAFVRANSTKIADLKGHGPKGIRTELWDGLVDIWMTP
ncbi:hypothetical protein SESBI_30710 [Sesbania bispinosa]|nr:hypothetical protein SESBI_30710 [Sesbania bispinosa]